ncbi:MAG: hypothetical protein ACLSHX_17900 [Suilimivivens sp.]
MSDNYINGIILDFSFVSVFLTSTFDTISFTKENLSVRFSQLLFVRKINISLYVGAFCPLPATLVAACITSLNPFPVVDIVLMTGHPSLSDNAFSSIFVSHFGINIGFVQATTTSIPSSEAVS